MALKNLGIIGGGQLGSMMSSAAKKLDIRTVIYSDDKDAPAQKFSDNFLPTVCQLSEAPKTPWSIIIGSPLPYFL